MAPLRRLGDFEILGELGRGGMGIVYQARQVSLNRRVALKVLSGTLGLTSKAVIRFKREAEAAARLHHTNIVPIYATGDQDGTHYYAMEMIDGSGLDRVIAQMRQDRAGTHPDAMQGENQTISDTTQTSESLGLTRTLDYGPLSQERAEPQSSSASSLSAGGKYFDALARMMADVADALDYAHSQGVVHRDIKPANLLLSSQGRLHVNDFGLARMLEQPGMTVSGEFVGSPMYMSPEQIAVGRAPLDHRTDIYSLGATLYQMLTLEPPFAGDRRDQVIGQIMHKEPRRPRSINRKIPLDLETICLKAMEKDPDKRYQTAGDMAKDLRAYANRFAISARRIGPAGRAVRWARRHKALAGAMACALIAILVAAGIGYRSLLVERQRRAEAIENELQEATRIALNRDYDRAEQALDRAIQLGATGGRVHLLRGQIAGHRGDPQTDLVETKLAVEAMPQSQEARASLALAYIHAHQWDNYIAVLEQAEALPSRTPEDYLLMGHAWRIEDPERGLAMLDKAVELRATPEALLVRASLRSSHAMDTADPRLVELALADVAATKTILPSDDTDAMDAAMIVWANASRIYYMLGMQPQREAVLKLMAADYAVREKRPLSLPGGNARMYYLLETDQADAAKELATILYRNYRTNAAFHAWDLYERALSDQCVLDRKLLAEAVSIMSPDELDAALMCPDLGEDGRGQAMLLYEEVQSKGNAEKRTNSHCIPLLLGDRDRARKDALALRASAPVMPSWHDWNNKLLDYQCELLSDKELIEAAGQSLYSRREAYFSIGLRRLSEGQRDQARALFRKCVDTRLQFGSDYLCSVAFLDRMAKDPQWPRWLPASPGAAPSTQDAVP